MSGANDQMVVDELELWVVYPSEDVMDPFGEPDVDPLVDGEPPLETYSVLVEREFLDHIGLDPLPFGFQYQVPSATSSITDPFDWVLAHRALYHSDHATCCSIRCTPPEGQVATPDFDDLLEQTFEIFDGVTCVALARNIIIDVAVDDPAEALEIMLYFLREVTSLAQSLGINMTTPRKPPETARAMSAHGMLPTS